MAIIVMNFCLICLDWLVFRQPGGNRYVIGEPVVDKNKNVGYLDYATLSHSSEPQLFMICDMKGKGLKLRDVRYEMSVKIMAQKSHFFHYKYLSADDDSFNGSGKYTGASKRNINLIQSNMN